MKLKNSKNKKLLRTATKFFPWDYEFLLDIERQALTQMAEYFENHGITSDNQLCASRIRLAIRLLDIANEKDRVYDVRNDTLLKYVNVKNSYRFAKLCSSGDSPILKDLIRQRKAWYLYNKIRFQYMRTWWD